MQVTIDIPEPLYGRLASKATAARVTLETLVLDGAERVVSETPIEQVIPSRPTLLSMNVNVNDLTLMTGDEVEAFERAFAENPENAVLMFGLRKLNDGDAT